MARTRRNAMTIEEARQKIRTTQLLNRLHDHVFKGVKMNQTQVKAVEILMRKVLPDLAAVELSGEVTNNVVTAEPITEQEWQTMVAPPASDALHD